MSHQEFSHLLHTLSGLSPEQLAAVRRQLDQMEQPATPTPANAHTPIWEEFEDIAATIPTEEWRKMPVDGAEQHDHYIYGSPKRPPSQ
jgi:hypothetical protein